MATTINRNYPRPDETRTVAEELVILRDITLAMIDGDVHALMQAVANLADKNHRHEITDVDGLAQALSGFMDKGKTFSLADLADVVGADEAPDGYVLVKVAGDFVAQAASAALGAHKHPLSDIVGGEAIANQLAQLEAKVSGKNTISSAAPAGGVDGDTWDLVEP